MKNSYKQHLPQHPPKENPRKQKKKGNKAFSQMTSWWKNKQEFIVLHDDTLYEDESSEERYFDFSPPPIWKQPPIPRRYQTTQEYQSPIRNTSNMNETGNSPDRSLESLDSLTSSHSNDTTKRPSISNMLHQAPKHLFDNHLDFMMNQKLRSQKMRMEAAMEQMRLAEDEHWRRNGHRFCIV